MVKILRLVENETHTFEIWKTSNKDEVVTRTERSLGLYNCKTYKSYTSAWKGKEYQRENQASAVVMFLNFKLLRQKKLLFKWINRCYAVSLRTPNTEKSSAWEVQA